MHIRYRCCKKKEDFLGGRVRRNSDGVTDNFGKVWLKSRPTVDTVCLKFSMIAKGISVFERSITNKFSVNFQITLTTRSGEEWK